MARVVPAGGLASLSPGTVAARTAVPILQRPWQGHSSDHRRSRHPSPRRLERVQAWRAPVLVLRLPQPTETSHRSARLQFRHRRRRLAARCAPSRQWRQTCWKRSNKTDAASPARFPDLRVCAGDQLRHCAADIAVCTSTGWGGRLQNFGWPLAAARTHPHFTGRDLRVCRRSQFGRSRWEARWRAFGRALQL